MRRCWLLALLIKTSIVFAQDSTWLARTTGKLPYIKYGIGDDRLGGAKMTYLDSNIFVTIVDSFNADYLLQLSKYHTAYIPKEDVVLLKKTARKPVHNPDLSSAWKAYGDQDADYVLINLARPVPYRSTQLINPSRISIDLFGITSNTNWINQLSSAREIKNIWYEQVEDDVLRVTIELKHPQHWGHTISYDSSGKKLLLKIKRPPTILDIRKLRIAIDAGHGGDNNGTSGVSGNVVEKQYTLVLAKELEKTLKTAGVSKVFMTRTKDTSLSIVERVEMLRQFNPDLLVSIHLNAADADTVQGVSTYYRYIGFRPLSMAILNQLLTLGLKEYGNIGSFNFGLNGPTDYPNTLIELGFLSNRQDEKRILSPRFQKAVAQKIYLGIQNWLKQQKP
ncbi:MAG TPA: N-acetylmuramoyl-L-alanine amidase [Puia sp.]|nr:N-acetylmuramoyl-L-alanine amidase [Puia sp.]